MTRPAWLLLATMTALVAVMLVIGVVGDPPECRTGPPHTGKGHVYEASLPECP